MKILESAENYLESILILRNEKGRVRSIDIVNHLGFSKPSVSIAMKQLEENGDYSARLALLEEQKSLPWQAVWEMYCQRHDAPAGSQWLDNVRAYEKDVLAARQ